MIFKLLIILIIYRFNGVLCESKSSLAFVIDDTCSMHDDIEEVKTKANEIFEKILERRESQIKNFVLVTFNDPQIYVRTITTNRHNFKNYLDSIIVSGGDDCPEYSLSGIYKALSVSSPGSNIYVFTDASAKDYYIHDKVKNLAQKKSSQITFVLTGICRSYFDEDYLVYISLANATNGQVFISNKTNVGNIVDVIITDNTDKTGLVTSQVIPERKLVNNTFNVDDTMRKILITTSGINTSMKIYTPDNKVKVTKIMWNDNTKAVEVTYLVPGVYTVEVYGESTTFFRVTAKTDFTFKHGFSNFKPNMLKETTSQPIADEKNYLSVDVTDPNNEVKIQTAQIMDINENVLMELHLQRVNGNFYTTDSFVSPNHTMKIAVKGKLKENGQTVRRVAKTPVEPTTIFRRPVIDKSQTKIVTNELSTVKIPCKILDSKLKPKIIWSFKSNTLSSYERILENNEELIVKINSISQAGIYRCTAENPAGKDQHDTEIVVTYKPRMNIIEGTNFNVKYDHNIHVTCKVTAVPEAQVEWRDEHGAVISGKDRQLSRRHLNLYSNTLHLKNLKRSKKYYCFATNSRGTESMEINVAVLSPFQSAKNEIINIEYGKPSTIPCKVTSDYPVNMKWIYKPDNLQQKDAFNQSQNFYISQNNEIIITYMDLNLRGKYICTVSLLSDKNEYQSYEVELRISNLAAPELEKTPTSLVVREKSHASIPCKIKRGVPRPKVAWYFKNKQSVEFTDLSQSGEVLKINNIVLTNAGIYKCIATNELGKDESISELTVLAPARIINDVNEYNGVVGDIAMRIPCNVTGYPNPIIKWSFKGKPIIQGEKYLFDKEALVIKNPDKSDSLQYTCKAENEFGSDVKTFTAAVTDYTNYENAHVLHILNGTSKTVSCPLAYTETDSIRWFKNGYYINVTAPYMNFVDATVLMDGNYTCRVSNKLGTKYDTVEVFIGFSPKFKIKVETDVTDWDGEGDMNCDVDSNTKPYAKTEWFYNGKPILSAENSSRHDISGWGEFTCRVSNVHGSSERTFTISSEACLIDKNGESIMNAPVILSEHSTLPEFESIMNYMIIDPGVKFKLYCAKNSSSFQNFPDKTEIDVTCDRENRFSYEGKLYKYSDFRCNKEVEPIKEKTGISCLGKENSEIIRVGFGKTFAEVYEVCFDKDNNVPLFTHLSLTDSSNSENKNELKWSNHPEIGNNNQDKLYTCVNNATCCYAKRQMVNANDISFGPMQISTYIEPLNAVPVWQPCNERTTWPQIEEAVKLKVSNDQTPLSVWTGASNYTQKNGGKIPKYLWKVIKSSEELTMAIVYVNDETPEDSDILCNNICSGERFLYLKPKDKFTYCCELDDFVRAFGLPKNMFV